jgi:hypothetical protein
MQMFGENSPTLGAQISTYFLKKYDKHVNIIYMYTNTLIQDFKKKVIHRILTSKANNSDCNLLHKSSNKGNRIRNPTKPLIIIKT